PGSCPCWPDSSTSVVAVELVPHHGIGLAAKFFGTDSKPGTCNNLSDLEGVATHERGHTFGLADINATDHPNLTMGSGSSIGVCSVELRSLGKGDILGLNDMYNA